MDMTLPEFLLARIAERERRAYAYRETKPEVRYNWTRQGDPNHPDEAVEVRYEDRRTETMSWETFCDRHMELFVSDPTLLAECEAKRRVVELHGRDHECSTYDRHGEIDNCTWVLHDERPCSTLLLLASVYADHPDYREEWRP